MRNGQGKPCPFLFVHGKTTLRFALLPLAPPSTEFLNALNLLKPPRCIKVHILQTFIYIAPFLVLKRIAVCYDIVKDVGVFMAS
jgi:hypothetical protein